MTYTQKGNEVILQMTEADFDRLLVMLGVALAAVNNDPPLFWQWLAFVNDLNRTNPGFIQYEIPAQPNSQ